MNKIITTFAILITLLFSYNITNASSEQKISLDNKTVVKGYTIVSNDKLLSIAVKPNAFAGATIFTVNKSEVNEKTINNQKIKSALYSVSFNNKPKTPLLIKINWQSFSNLPKNVYWRGYNQNQWQQLPTKIVDKQAIAEIIDSGDLIVLEQTATNINDITKHVSAKSFAVIDAGSGKVLLTKNGNQVRSIASLTKLMTAMIYLERPVAWQTKTNITKEDKDIPVTIGLKDNEEVDVKSLWFATLTKSANDAAKALARISGLNKNDFVKRMNSWAKELDLKNTSFSDPSGLDKNNKSTAIEVATLARAAFTYPDIVEATGTKELTINTNQNRNLILKNSTTLFDSDLKIIAAKTGYTTEAGRCQIIKADGEKRSVIVVVLGSGFGKHTTDAYDLASWFTNN